jgi:hypothetical protein
MLKLNRRAWPSGVFLRPLRRLLLLLLRKLQAFLSTAPLPRPMFGVDTLRRLLGFPRLLTRSLWVLESLDRMASGRKKPVPAGLLLTLLLCGESAPFAPTSATHSDASVHPRLGTAFMNRGDWKTLQPALAEQPDTAPVVADKPLTM